VYQLGQIIGGVILMYLLLRLWQWVFGLFSSAAATPVLIPAIAAYSTGVVLGGYGLANGGSPAFGTAAMVYLIPIGIASILELARQSRARG